MEQDVATAGVLREEEDVRVVLNVGGHRYETYMSTLLKYPTTLLATMFGERNAPMVKKDEAGEYFFDRNGDAFGVILEWYRSGMFCIPPHVPIDVMKQEADFFQVPIPTTEMHHGRIRLGDELRSVALAKACDQVKAHLDRVIDIVYRASGDAASKGCRYCRIDFLKGDSYLRYSSGIDKSNPANFHLNVVDKTCIRFFKKPNNVFLFRRQLDNEGLTFTFSTTNGTKNFCLSVNLWGPDPPSSRTGLTLTNA